MNAEFDEKMISPRKNWCAAFEFRSTRIMTPRAFENRVNHLIPQVVQDVGDYFTSGIPSLEYLERREAFSQVYGDISFRMSVKPDSLESVSNISAGNPQEWVEDYPAQLIMDTRTRSVFFDVFQDSLDFMRDESLEHTGHYYLRNWNNWTLYENGAWLDWYGETNFGCEEDED